MLCFPVGVLRDSRSLVARVFTNSATLSRKNPDYGFMGLHRIHSTVRDECPLPNPNPNPNTLTLTLTLILTP